jgi:glutamyl-Q tRNA(Asp) synthetase
VPKQQSEERYIGRFAPSPSGPLHTGSLVAAMASYLDARANNGLWYVRMEDLDPPRESAKAATLILQTLEQLHLFWDADVLYQSQRHQAYQSALETLQQLDLTFPCTCSRQQIQDAGGIHHDTCDLIANLPFSIRCRSSQNTVNFTDIFQGQQSQSMNKDVGDFVIKRKDGFYAYQLAVVVDDAFQNINHIIRGIDLLDSTSRQITLQSYLGFPKPRYGHIPVVVNEQGQKLSKQHFAQAVTLNNPQQLLVSVLTCLQQSPEPTLADSSIDDILSWAIKHWKPENLAGLKALNQVSPNVSN